MKEKPAIHPESLSREREKIETPDNVERIFAAVMIETAKEASRAVKEIKEAGGIAEDILAAEKAGKVLENKTAAALGLVKRNMAEAASEIFEKSSPEKLSFALMDGNLKKFNVQEFSAPAEKPSAKEKSIPLSVPQRKPDPAEELRMWRHKEQRRRALAAGISPNEHSFLDYISNKDKANITPVEARRATEINLKLAGLDDPERKKTGSPLTLPSAPSA